MIEIIYKGLLFVLFAVTTPLAFTAILRKRQSNIGKPEPISGTILFATIAVLVIGKIFGQDIKGSKWLSAETHGKKTSTQRITLRKNGTFRIDLNKVDFGCYFSGLYQKHGDTVTLVDNVIEKTDSIYTTSYYFEKDLLIPLDNNVIKSHKFDTLIVQRKD